ncbi:hypothetical protein [Pseudomonas fulva]|nr:hypothetical protein [Pseudomonas fulva]MBF8780590.1 hypothetical protein [Pseudomonas fulva]
MKTFACLSLLAAAVALSGCHGHRAHDRDDGWRDRDHHAHQQRHGHRHDGRRDYR